MRYDFDMVSTDDLVAELTRRSKAVVLVRAQKDDDGQQPEYRITVRGEPHELLGLVQILDIQVRDMAYGVIFPMEDEEDDA